ncbi:MAG: type III-A CRISPR-associated RAMP protein Csm5 [Spirochaetales bacterium]|nr:type III-A CRISPR-associated RAMP protein Csm5 [Spirochaetales bacterium]
MKEILTIPFELLVITPVHIGNGLKYTKLDFVFDPDSHRAGILHERKWLDWLTRQGWVEFYIDAVSRYGRQMDNYTWLRQQRVLDPFKTCSELFLSCFHVDQQQNTLNDVLEHTKTVHLEPYIPGSSIKGALRTAIMSAMLIKARESGQEMGHRVDMLWRDIQNQLHSSNRLNTRYIHTQIDRLLFKAVYDRNGKPLNRMLADPFRGFLVSDSTPVASDAINISKKHDLVAPVRRQAVNEISIWRECIKPTATMRFTVSLDRQHLADAGMEYIVSAEGILDSVRTHQARVLEYHEKRLSEVFQNTASITETQYRPIAAPKEYTAIKLGSNTGFQLKSLIYSLAPDCDSARQTVETILEQQFYKKHRYRDNIAAPRTLKTTLLGVQPGIPRKGRYKMGICGIKEIQA